MVSRGARFFVGLLLVLSLSGCIDEPVPAYGPSLPVDPTVDPVVPVEAGLWNGTAVTFGLPSITETSVRHVRFVSPVGQRCEAVYESVGNVSEAWTTGWAVAWVSGRSPVSHGFVQSAMAEGQVAGGALPSMAADFPRNDVTSRSTIGFGGMQAGDTMEYVVVASYPAGSGEDPPGRMDVRIECPGGMDELRTAWSTRAHLLSEISLTGTWANADAHPEEIGPVARAGVHVDASWSASLGSGNYSFIAREPKVGRVVLETDAGSHVCGPASTPGDVTGRSLCACDFGGGDVRLDATQASLVKAGPVGTSDHWMGLVAELSHHAWQAPS